MTLTARSKVTAVHIQSKFQMGPNCEFEEANQYCLNQFEPHIKYFQCEGRFDLDLILKVTAAANRFDSNNLKPGTFHSLWVLRVKTMHVDMYTIHLYPIKVSDQFLFC